MMMEDTYMKVMHITNLEKFFETIDSCTGKVELVGRDIRLNLKSKLTQYFSMAEIFSGGNEIPELEIHCENLEDNMKLIKFMAEANL